MPDVLQPEQVALALFEPVGIGKLSKRLSIGKNKATRVKKFADGMENWAIESGYRTAECDGFREFYFRDDNNYDPRP